MSERLGWRELARWALGIALLGYLLTTLSQDVEPAPSQATVAAVTQDGGRLRILDLRPVKVAPGGTIVVHLLQDVDTLDAELDGVPLERVSKPGHQDNQWAFLVPTNLPEGKAKIQLRSGERTSKKRRLEIKLPRHRKILRNALGGLALVVFGVHTLSRGLRRWSGARIRRHLSALASAFPRAVTSGTVAGGLTQTGATVAAIVISALQSRMVGPVAALGIMLGAHLGASVVGAVLPFGASREALLFVALGVLWRLLARDRRSRAIAAMMLGAGLLFHGLYLLRVGLGPLVDTPELISWASQIDASTWSGAVVCAAIGMALCTALQGPGPAFFAVLGLAQSTSLLGMDECVAILAGTSLGTAATTAFVSWPYGPAGRTLATRYLGLAAISTLAILATLPLWTALPAAMLGTEPHAVAFGKKILYPNIGSHLAIAFIASQLTATVLAGVCVQLVASRRSKVEPAVRKAEAELPELVQLIAGYLPVLEACRNLSAGGARTEAGRAERMLDQLSQRHDAFGSSLKDESSGAVLVGVSHLHRAFRELLHAADQAVDAGLELREQDKTALERMHELLEAGLRELSDENREVDMEEARAREIRLNATEAALRRRAVAEGGRVVEASLLLAAYEATGNQIFRLAQTLDEETL